VCVCTRVVEKKIEKNTKCRIFRHSNFQRRKNSKCRKIRHSNFLLTYENLTRFLDRQTDTHTD
jgi:hypothetical protein